MEDVGLFVGYILLLLSLVAATALPLISALKSPKELGKSLMGLGVLVVVFLIAYGLAGSEVTPGYLAAGITESTSKVIGAGLTMFYIVFVLAVIGIIYSEINKALK